MSTIQIYHEDANRFYNVNVNMFATALNTGTTGSTEYYLKITTDMRRADGTAYPTYVIKTMTDYPTGYTPSVVPTTIAELINVYIDYYILNGITASSSTSSSSVSSSSNTSSSTLSSASTSSSSTNSSSSTLSVSSSSSSDTSSSDTSSSSTDTSSSTIP